MPSWWRRLDGLLTRRSKVFCVLPWVHAHVRPDGDVLPCCEISAEPVGNVRSGTLAALWNAPGMRELRKRMLAGKKSAGCAGCYRWESLGLKSLRQTSNERFGHHAWRRKLTKQDGSLEKPFMASMDVRFSNLCNFKCRICVPSASSAWREDALKLGQYAPDELVLRPSADLWEQLEPHFSEAEEVNFAGGEPLLMEEHYRVLEKLGRDVRLTYHTNLSSVSRVLPLWKRFSSVKVVASVDAAGKRGEYLRKGMVWEEFLANAARIRRETPHVKLGAQTVLSAHNAGHLLDLHAALRAGGIHGSWTIVPLIQPAEYSAHVLPRAFREEQAAAMRRYAEERLSGYDAAQLRGAAAHLLCADREDLRERFLAATLALDELRGERFCEAFPELGHLQAAL